jgi:aspartate aminotransferase
MNPRLDRISGSLIREIAAKRTPSSIDLGLGEPSLMPAEEHLQAGMRYALQRGLRYTLNAGDAELRKAIAAHYNYPKMNAAENVCVTTGSQEATYATIKTLLDPASDELLVVEPAFPSYAKMAALEGIAVRKAAMSEADGFAFDAERILAAVTPQTRLIVICSPCNPTARVMDRTQAARLSEGLLQRGGDPVWVLHDEIYREQTYVEDACFFAQVYPYTIVTNSVSKSNALTGLRLGWVLAPAHVTAAIVKVHAWLTSCADTFSQQVALHVFTTPGSVREHAQWYEGRHREVCAVLEQSGLRYIPPEGTFYVCIALPGHVDSLPAAHSLADDYGVIAVPGIAFGECFAHWLRLTWVSPVERFTEGIGRIAAFISKTHTETGKTVIK